MVSATAIILEYICPAMGTLFANLMWLAPISSANKAVATNFTLGELNPLPWAMMLGNCVGWVAYSFIVKDYWPLVANAPGVIIAVWLNLSAAKLQYHDELTRALEQRNDMIELGVEKTNLSSVFYSKAYFVVRKDDVAPTCAKNTDGYNPQKVLVMPLLPRHDQIVLFMVLLWSSVLSVVGFWPMTKDNQQTVVGVIVNLNLVFFYGGPLSTIFEVLSTKNSASIHLKTLTMNSANALFWTAYAISISDIYIALPNGIGVILGVLQALLVLIIPKRPLNAKVDGISVVDVQEDR